MRTTQILRCAMEVEPGAMWEISGTPGPTESTPATATATSAATSTATTFCGYCGILAGAQSRDKHLDVADSPSRTGLSRIERRT